MQHSRQRKQKNKLHPVVTQKETDFTCQIQEIPPLCGGESETKEALHDISKDADLHQTGQHWYHLDTQELLQLWFP